MNAVGIDVSKGKSMVPLQNNFISLTGKTFPGVNELFKTPERADGHQKWVDFVPSFWHCECVCRVSEAAFIQRYRKWCKHKGYNFSEEKARSLYADSCGHITTPPKSDNTKLRITIAAQLLLAANKFLRIYYARVKECLAALDRADTPEN